jgi:flagellar hook-associated protein 2
MVTPSITSLGIGTGIDANSIVEKLMALERAPLNILAQREISYNAKISAFGSLKTRFDAIKTAADKMADPATLAAFTATVGDSDVVTASAGSLAGPGSYNVNVLQLAQAQKSFTGLYGSSDTFAAGTLTFTINGTDHDITFDGGSLADVRSVINAADIGVTATTVTGDAGARLVLTSSETGTDNAFSLAVTGGDANLASLATFDGAHPNALAAQNASIEVEGETVTSQSNTVTGAIPDVTLTLGSVGSTTVDIARSSASAVDTVKDFVTAFNAAVTELRTVSARPVAQCWQHHTREHQRQHLRNPFFAGHPLPVRRHSGARRDHAQQRHRQRLHRSHQHPERFRHRVLRSGGPGDALRRPADQQDRRTERHHQPHG